MTKVRKTTKDYKTRCTYKKWFVSGQKSPVKQRGYWRNHHCSGNRERYRSLVVGIDRSWRRRREDRQSCRSLRDGEDGETKKRIERKEKKKREKKKKNKCLSFLTRDCKTPFKIDPKILTLRIGNIVFN